MEDNAQKYLSSYVEIYLKEEIQMEALTRNLAGYHRFLNAAACMNGEIVNFSKIADDAQLKANTVRDYYQILQDTLIGELLPSWKKSTKRKAVSKGKFYFFDLGVVNALKNVWQLEPGSDPYGKAFEHFIYGEIKASINHYENREQLSHWRSQSGNREVDFVIGDKTAIEVKSKNNIFKRDILGLLALSEEKTPWKNKLLVSRDPQRGNFADGIVKIPWQDFLQNLWQGKYF